MSTLRRIMLSLAATLAMSAAAYGAAALRPDGQASSLAVETAGRDDAMYALLDRAANMGFDDYNPAHVIAAVNALRPLGKEEALARIDSYLEGRDGLPYPDGLFWVLRTLFEMPAGRPFPPAGIGRPNISPPAGAEHLPRFPVVVVQDVPLLVVRGYALAGLPEPVERHVAYFRAHGVLPARSLTPPASRDGKSVV